MASVVIAAILRAARSIVFLTSFFIFLTVLPTSAWAVEYVVSTLLPSTLGGKTFWADVTERTGSAPFLNPGASFQVVLTATGSNKGTFTAPAAGNLGVRSGTWNAGFTGGGSVQQPGNYLFISFTGLHGDGMVDTLIFYPAVYSGPNQIPCDYYLYRGGTDVFGNGAADTQRGNMRVTDGSAPAPFAPKITFLTADAVYFSGSSPVLSAEVLGSYPLSYQWSKDNVPILNATNSKLILTNIPLTGGGIYALTASNSVGSISSNVTVTVNQSVGPAIVTQPQSALVFPNETGSLSVTATGTAPLVYQWLKDGVSLPPNAFYFGTTNSQLLIVNFKSTNAGDYAVIISNYAGSITSSVATLNLGTAPVLNQQPEGTNLVVGQSLLLTVGATGPSLTYGWYKGTTYLASSTNHFFIKTNMSYADRGDYTVQVSNPLTTVTSTVAHVEMYFPQPPYYNASLPNVTTNAGANVTFAGWFSAVPAPTFTWRKNGVDIPGATGLAPNIVSNFTDFYSVFTLTNISIADVAAYSVAASNSQGTSETPAASLIIPLSTAPIITFQPTNQTLFPGDNAAFRIGYISQTPVTVRWYSNSIPAATSTTNYSPVLAGLGNYDFFATASNAFGVATSLTARATVKVRPGTTDPAFNPDTFDSAVNALVPQVGGGVIVGGDFTFVGSSNRNRVARLLANGTLDTTWTAAFNNINATVYALSQQADGKLLVGGDFTLLGNAPGPQYSRLARLNTDGTLDTSFACGTTDGSLAFSNTVKAIAQRGDGYFAVSGKFTNVLTHSQQCVALFDSHGVFQPAFHPAFSATTPSTLTVDALAFQPDGKLLVGGGFTKVDGTARNYLARLTSEGANDSTFSASPSSPIRSILVLPDGQIMAGSASPASISRFATNGAFANIGFGQGAGGGTGVFALAQQESGHILIGGDYTSSFSLPNHGVLTRVLGDGSLDASFKSYANSAIYAIAVGPDGGVWVGGTFTYILPEKLARSRVAKLIAEAPPVGAPALGAPMFVSGVLQMQFNTVNNHTYQIEYKTSLEDSNWILYQAISGDGTTKTVSISPIGGSAFFRLNLLP